MATESDNRSEEVKEFEESKSGVKGLVDSGKAATTIPSFFIHPLETLSTLRPHKSTSKGDVVPVIDLSGADSAALRPLIVEKIVRASREVGLFQVVNHGVGKEVLEGVIGGIRGFHEQSPEMKARVYRREMKRGVMFLSNTDLFLSKAASWRDTLRVKLGPTLAELDEIPEICRNEVLEWNQEMMKVGETLLGLLSEGLGLETGRLKEKTLLEDRLFAGQYYPFCPQPDLTLGIASHSDPGAFTILFHNEMGGLQIKHGHDWIGVNPVPGALVVNIGDILQVMSNDAYKSVEHRVLANPRHEPRISVVVFFSPGEEDGSYGPLPELISPENPPHFKSFTYGEHIRTFFSKEFDGKSMLNYYRLTE